MNATTVAIDLAKDVFEVAFADAGFRIVQRKRVRRNAFAGLFDNRAPPLVVMGARGSGRYWARGSSGCGIDDAGVSVRRHTSAPHD